MQPSRVVTHPAGLTESYDLVTERTFSTFFERVSEERFRALAATQSDLPLFPFTPLSPTLSIGESVSTGGNRSIVLYCERVAIRATSDGGLATTGFGFQLDQRLSTTAIASFTYRWLGDAPNVKILQELPRSAPIGQSAGQATRRGDSIAQFLGSGPFDNGRYSGAANQLGFSALSWEKLPEPLVTVRPDGTRVTTVAATADRTPSISKPFEWIHTDSGKIAVIV